MAVGYENALTTGVAELLAEAGVGVWDPEGAYVPGAGLPVITVGLLPEIDRDVIALSTYVVNGGFDPVDSVTGLQVRTRARGEDPRAVSGIEDSVYRVLHGRRGVGLLGYRITKILLISGASLGQDGSGRWGRTSNYYITGPRPIGG